MTLPKSAVRGRVNEGDSDLYQCIVERDLYVRPQPSGLGLIVMLDNLKM
jgi:hypothetical protein